MLSAMRRMLRRVDKHKGGSPVRSISRDASGNVLPMIGVGLMVMAALVGGGVDMARAYKTERRLQAACDAGVLAGRRAVANNGFDSTALGQANAYFNNNYHDSQQQTTNTVFTPTSSNNGSTVEGVASTRLNTIIMKIFGYKKFDLAVNCSASMGVGNSDVIMVLDNTGSMADEPDGTSPESGELSKIQALRAAMKDFYDTVKTATDGTNSRIRYGFVPYSSAVNVGHLIYDLNPSYLADTITVQSLKLVNWSTTPIATWSDPGFTYTSASYTSWTNISSQYSTTAACTAALPANTAWADTGSATNTYSYSVETDDGHQIKTTGIHQPQTNTEYRCSSRRIQQRTGSREKRSSMYEERTQVEVTTGNTSFTNAVLQQRSFDVSTYKTFTAVTLPIGIANSYDPDRTSNVTSTWAGCIQERETTPASSFTFVSLETGITPSAATDLDIDEAPGGDDSTKWSPLWPQVAYTRDSDVPFENLDDSNNGNISDSEISENNVTTYCPQQAQLLAEISEEDFDGYADSLIAVGNTYHDIGMLWGARLSSPTGLWSSLVNEEPSNGATVSRHMIFMTDGELAPSLTVNSTYGIEEVDKRITGNGDSDDQYNNHMSRFLALCEAVKARGIRLWVIAFGTSLTTELTTCATDGLASAFHADDSDELNEHFQEIANQVGELRIIQ